MDDLGYRELYVRWFQLGAFLPVFRAHGTDVRREVWAFGEEGSVWYEALAKRFACAIGSCRIWMLWRAMCGSPAAR